MQLASPGCKGDVIDEMFVQSGVKSAGVQMYVILLQSYYRG